MQKATTIQEAPEARRQEAEGEEEAELKVTTCHRTDSDTGSALRWSTISNSSHKSSKWLQHEEVQD